MKILLPTCFFLLFALNYSFGQICAMDTNGEESAGYDDCLNPHYCSLTESNKYFIPVSESQELTVNIYPHVIQHSDPQVIQTFREDNPDHADFIIRNIQRAADDQFRGMLSYPDEVEVQETCSNVQTGNFAVDAKIKFNIMDITWHTTSEVLDITNDGHVCNNRAFNNFIGTGNTSFQDGLNIIYLENAGDNGGCANSLENPSSRNYITINDSYTLNYAQNGNDWQNVAHEIGHAFGLHHSWKQCVNDAMNYGCNVVRLNEFTAEYNHVMYAGSSTQLYFNEYEVAQMRRYLLTTSRRDWLTEIPVNNDQLVINTSTTWSDPITWIGDIIIPAISTLTIQSTLRMQEGKVIYVERGGKAIIDGGMITSCDEKWEGVKVEGAPPKAFLNGQLNDPNSPSDATYAGTVIMTSGGTIDNARNGISTNNDHLGWPDVRLYRGGLVHCNNANFTNCDRAVEFMKYGNPNNLDKSSFHQTTFQDCKHGVTNWASDGVTFTQCHFENIDNEAIVGHEAAIDVIDGNNFYNCGIGVQLTGTSINPLSSRIGDTESASNTFDASTGVGVYIICDRNADPTIVSNNEFESFYGTFVDGPSKVECYENDFSQSINGFYAVDSKDNNVVRNNLFENNTIAIELSADNSMLQFEDNCMDFSLEYDVKVAGDLANPGQVFENQGNQFFGAGNDFSKNGIHEIRSIGTTQSFNYFVPTDYGPGTVYYPDGNGNFDVEDADVLNLINCGTGNIAPPNPPSGVICETPSTESELLSQINTLDQEIVVYAENKTILATKQRCLNASLDALLFFYQNSDGLELAYSYFAQRPEFMQRTIPFSIRVAEENYEDARNYLNQLVSVNPAESNYKISQTILLDYFTEEGFELSSSEEIYLINTGNQFGPLNAYSRAIYYVISGELIQLPRFQEAGQENRLAPEEGINDEKLAVYPNPATFGQIHLEGIDFSKNPEIKITDNLGRIHIQNSLSSNQLNLDLSPGIYFVQLKQNNKPNQIEKLIIQ